MTSKYILSENWAQLNSTSSSGTWTFHHWYVICLRAFVHEEIKWVFWIDFRLLNQPKSLYRLFGINVST